MSFTRFIIMTLFAVSAFKSFSFSNNVNRLGACFDNCNYSFKAKEVVGWNNQGFGYVVDYKNKSLHKYYVYMDYVIEGSDRWPVQKTKPFALTSSEKKAIPELLKIYDETKDALIIFGAMKYELNDNFEFRTIKKANEIKPSFDSEMSTMDISFGEYFIISHPGGKNAYDFLDRSAFRNELYSNLFNNDYRIRQQAYINKVFDLLNLGSFGLADLEFTFTVSFPDGSSVEVAPDLTTATLIPMPGTAVDASGNSIPTNVHEAVGTYEFQYEQARFVSDYLGRWGGNFEFRYCPVTIELKCSFSHNTLTCTVITPACQL